MKRMFPIAAVLAVLAASTDSDAAFADLRTLPHDVQPYMAYLSTSHVAPEHREQLANVIRFVAPSLSSRPYLADQLPRRIVKTNLLRIDLQGLGWEKSWPKVIAQHYTPNYRPDLHAGQVPLVVSGLWFVSAVIDPQITGTAQYELLYGTPPKTLAEFQKFWRVTNEPGLFFGRIEGESGVSVQRQRLLENQPTGNRSYSWQTYDSRVIAGKNDPLENITARPPQHDASEAIAGIPKHLGGRSGTLQAYFLADAKGNRQEKAPADIVTDSTGTRGVEIRNTLSCVACHVEGIRHPTIDQWREYVTSGARLYVKDKATQQEIDRYLDSPIAKEIGRNNEDYAAGVEMCNGLTPADNAAAFRQMVLEYDRPLDLEAGSRWLYTTGPELRLALGNYSRTYQLTGRLALYAQGQTISRDQFAANFRKLQEIVALWHAPH